MSLVFERQQQPTYDARVAFIQLLLGFTGTGADGLFGLNTEARVKQFQRDCQIPDDGRVDERTGRALKLPYWDTQISRNDLESPFRDPNTFPEEDHAFLFKSEIETGGHFSSQPEQFLSGTLNKRTVRALRTNNPGALNISNWQKLMPGYVGRTHDDGSGNRTTIYLTPEKGVEAWHELIVVLYGHKPDYIQNGTFSLSRLAKAYAGLSFSTPDSHPAVAGYLAGWRKWSQRISESHLASDEIDPTDAEQLSRLAIAMFSHEASFATPLSSAQVRNGLDQAQLRITGPRDLAAAPLGAHGLHRKPTLADLEKAPVAGGAVDPKTAQEEENANGEQRAQRMLQVLEWEENGLDVNEASEK